MKDVKGLMQLAFQLAHEVADACLAMEHEPGMRQHRPQAVVMADGGVSALAHVAAASADLTDPSFSARLNVTRSLRGAREELRILRQRINSARGLHRLPDEEAEGLSKKIDDLCVVLMALAVEVGGNRMAA